MSSQTAESGKHINKGLQQGQRIAMIATLVTFFLAVGKAVVGYLFDSKILVADAFHSGADLLAIFAAWFGLWLASKKKTKRFPYGLYKAETLVTLIVGGLITWVGLEILIEGYHKLFYIAQLRNFPIFPVSASILSIITSFLLAKREMKIGRSINSQSLVANTNESILDIFTSLVVLTGILLAYLRIPYVEGSIIIVMSLLIIILGLKNIWISLLILMDANLDPTLQSEIEEKINNIYGVKGVGRVMIRQSGPLKMVECEILTSPSLSFYKAHQLADMTEAHIVRYFKHIESVFVHVEPLREKYISAIVPVQNIDGLDSEIYGHFGRAPYFIIVRLTNNGPEIKDFYYNEFLGEKKHIGLKVIKIVIKYKLDLLFTSQIGEISFHVLKDNFVDIYQAQQGLTVREIIERFQNHQIEQIMAPTHSVEQAQSSIL